MPTTDEVEHGPAEGEPLSERGRCERDLDRRRARSGAATRERIAEAAAAPACGDRCCAAPTG